MSFWNFWKYRLTLKSMDLRSVPGMGLKLLAQDSGSGICRFSFSSWVSHKKAETRCIKKLEEENRSWHTLLSLTVMQDSSLDDLLIFFTTVQSYWTVQDASQELVEEHGRRCWCVKRICIAGCIHSSSILCSFSLPHCLHLHPSPFSCTLFPLRCMSVHSVCFIALFQGRNIPFVNMADSYRCSRYKSDGVYVNESSRIINPVDLETCIQTHTQTKKIIPNNFSSNLTVTNKFLMSE